MRVLFTLLLLLIPAEAQTPLVRLLNTTHPASRTFQIGDQFEILLTGPPNQPISVRTTMDGRIDWGPIIGSTDTTGKWSTQGQFEKSDFGSWREIWTIGGKLASPAVQFSVTAPCLPGGLSFAESSGLHTILTCETAEGPQTFSTPSTSDAFRTQDGRSVPAQPTEQTQDAWQMGILQELITTQAELARPIALQSSRGARGDETAELITNLVGANALSEDETRNVLVILRAAFARPETIAPGAKYPAQTLKLLRHLADLAGESSLQRQIAETQAYVQTR